MLDSKIFILELKTDTFAGRELVLVGGQSPELIAVFDRRLADGTLLDFSLDEDVLLDQEGNRWDLLGRAIAGPRLGQRLPAPTAFVGYWFSWGAFYPELELYE